MMFKNIFPSISIEELDLIQNPFLDLSATNLSNFHLCEEEGLASLSSDRGLKLKYAKLPLDAFWIAVMEEYPTLSKNAIKVLLNFSTSYLCELGFPYINNIRCKKRERLKNKEEELSVCLSHSFTTCTTVPLTFTIIILYLLPNTGYVVFTLMRFPSSDLLCLYPNILLWRYLCFLSNLDRNFRPRKC